MGSPKGSRYQAFHDLLRDIRLESGLTQAQLAKRLRKPQSYISKIEQSERRVDALEWLDILRALDVSVTTFLHRLRD